MGSSVQCLRGIQTLKVTATTAAGKWQAARWMMMMMRQHVYAMYGIRDDSNGSGQDGMLPSVDDMR